MLSGIEVCKVVRPCIVNAHHKSCPRSDSGENKTCPNIISLAPVIENRQVSGIKSSRHRMTCRSGGPVDIPGDNGMLGEAKM